VIAAEQRDPAFSPVVDELEGFFLPSDPFAARAQLLLLRNAMLDLIELIWPEGESRPARWSRCWFRRAGAEESNSALLTIFASGWSYRFTAVARALSEFRAES
jgi:hypothetical protein